jgi:hypothetical protein
LPVIDKEHEEELSEEDRRVYAETILSVHAAAATHALEAKTFLRRSDHHLTRYTMNLDEAGWAEAAAAHMELYDRIYEIEAAAVKRMGESDEMPVRCVSFQNFFEVPLTVKTS